MDDRELEQLLTHLLRDDLPVSASAAADALFERRAESDELAELVEHLEDDDPTGRSLVFASAGHVVAVIVDRAFGVSAGRIEPPRSADVELVNVTGDTVSTRTDRNGAFHIDRTPPGRIQLSVTDNGGSARPHRPHGVGSTAGSRARSVAACADDPVGDRSPSSRPSCSRRAESAAGRPSAGRAGNASMVGSNRRFPRQPYAPRRRSARGPPTAPAELAARGRASRGRTSGIDRRAVDRHGQRSSRPRRRRRRVSHVDDDLDRRIDAARPPGHPIAGSADRPTSHHL